MTVPTPRAKQRQNAFTDIGVQGRKTGLTLRDLTRDQNGFEMVDGMFSSPEKAVVRSVKSRSGATNTASEDMEIDDGECCTMSGEILQLEGGTTQQFADTHSLSSIGPWA